jgi:hypothetical protein
MPVCAAELKGENSTMLITGGLLAFGIVSLLGAIFIARGAALEERAAATDKTRLGPTKISPAEVETPVAITEPAEDIALVSSKSQAFEQFLLMYEQFHELVEKIQLIHERSKAIEERLNRISDLVERIEEDETTLVGIPVIRQSGSRNS